MLVPLDRDLTEDQFDEQECRKYWKANATCLPVRIKQVGRDRTFPEQAEQALGLGRSGPGRPFWTTASHLSF